VNRGAAALLGVLALAVGLWLALDRPAAPLAQSPPAAELRWDLHGVPHLRAADAAGLWRGFGWAQAASHGERVLRLYGQARGRAAEYWGAEFLDSDRTVWTLGIPERAEEWFAEQDPQFRALLEAFADGFNAYAERHGERLDRAARRALPVRGSDPLAHLQRVLHFGLVAGRAGEAQALAGRGSNAWAVGGARSASGHGLLFAAPHLPWSDPWLWYEAHLACPEYEAYGAALVGFPVLGIAFNRHLGWTHTINTHDGADHYALELSGDRYRFEDQWRELETRRHQLAVRGRFFGTRSVEHRVDSSLHGPLIERDGERALALRVVGLDRPHALRQWWEMGRARDLAEFEGALASQQLPTFTVVYADDRGHVLHQFGGLTPVRAEPDRDWGGVLPGDRALTLWTEQHPLEQLPRVLDPETGWVHSANDPPWSATWPSPLRAEDFPAYLAPRFLHLAAQRSIVALLGQPEAIELEDLIAVGADCGVELAERWLPDLLRAVEEGGDAEQRAAGAVLAAWDRRLAADSRGAVLFGEFAARLSLAAASFAEPWDPQRALETPRGLAAAERALVCLSEAAAAVRAEHGRLDLSWGELHRWREGDVDLPASGGPRALGLLRAFDFALEGDGRRRAVGGEGFVAAVEFADPLRAFVQQAAGNGDGPRGAALPAPLTDLARGALRPALLDDGAIEAALAHREWIPGPPIDAP
jgi:acyl-homoserine-lactone acylase